MAPERKVSGVSFRLLFVDQKRAVLGNIKVSQPRWVEDKLKIFKTHSPFNHDEGYTRSLPPSLVGKPTTTTTK